MVILRLSSSLTARVRRRAISNHRYTRTAPVRGRQRQTNASATTCEVPAVPRN